MLRSPRGFPASPGPWLWAVRRAQGTAGTQCTLPAPLALSVPGPCSGLSTALFQLLFPQPCCYAARPDSLPPLGLGLRFPDFRGGLSPPALPQQPLLSPAFPSVGGLPTAHHELAGLFSFV